MKATMRLRAASHAIATVAAFSALSLYGTCAQAGTTVDDKALTDSRQGQNWLSYGRNYSEQRFSPLEQINAGNVGKLGLDQLELTDRLAELLALMHIRHDQVQAGLHDAERPGGEHRPFIVESRHQDTNAAADLAQDILLRHFAILEDKLAGRRTAHA